MRCSSSSAASAALHEAGQVHQLSHEPPGNISAALHDLDSMPVYLPHTKLCQMLWYIQACSGVKTAESLASVAGVGNIMGAEDRDRLYFAELPFQLLQGA